MVLRVFAKCCSLREVSGAMLGLSGKTKHFQLESIPYRSTLSDANAKKHWRSIFLFQQNADVICFVRYYHLNPLMKAALIESVIFK